MNELPVGHARCHICKGTGVSSSTTEPIASLMGREGIPDFQPIPLPCSDCSRRAMGVEPYKTGSAYAPYSIWYDKP